MIPLFYYPTQVYFLDDDPIFLEGIKFLASNAKLPVQASYDVQEALETLKRNTHEVDTHFHDYIKVIASDEDDFDDNVLSKDLSQLYHMHNDKNKEQDISVLIIDYKLPGITGIEFCRLINSLPIKKILVTGFDEKKSAIDAFNEGIISAYVVKNEEDFSNNILKLIKKMQYQYFCNASSKIGFSKDLDYNNKYKKIFDEFIKENNIIEFYSIDRYGSYLALDNNLKIHWFVVWPEKKLNDLLSVAIDYDADKTIIEKLNNKTHGIFLFSDHEKGQPVENWHNYLVEIIDKIQKNNNNYYYGIVSNKYFSLDK